MNFFFKILSITYLIVSQETFNYNLDLIHNINYENADNNFGVSDVWGYTDESGIEYAIVGYQYGTSIMNISEPNPIEVANILGPSSGDYYFHRDYKTFGDFLYIVNEMYGGDVGMQVVDLSPLPDNPPIQLDTYGYIAQSHNLWIDSSGFAFIEHITPDNIHITNLSDPSSPIYEGTFGTQGQYCHDIYTKNNIAYVSEGYGNQFGIYDISSFNNINLLASIPCQGYAHNAWLNDQGTHLITTEETQNKTVKIWDIRDLDNINLVGEYLGENGLAHNVHVDGNHAFISHYTTGIKIIDIFNPERPVEVAAYDTYPLDNDGGFYGCWGAYPFTSNNYVYASDMQNGLFIFDFNNANAGWINGYLYINNMLFPNSSIRSLLNNKTFFTNEDGYFDFGFPEGEHSFIINDSDTTQITFYAHQEENFNIYINNELISGDVNQDGIVNVIDIVQIVNVVLGGGFEPLADYNQDGLINIQDIVLIVGVILN